MEAKEKHKLRNKQFEAESRKHSSTKQHSAQTDDGTNISCTLSATTFRNNSTHNEKNPAIATNSKHASSVSHTHKEIIDDKVHVAFQKHMSFVMSLHTSF